MLRGGLTSRTHVFYFAFPSAGRCHRNNECSNVHINKREREGEGARVGERLPVPMCVSVCG